LIPRETSILCRQTQKNLLKKGKKVITKDERLGQNPQRKKNKTKNKKKPNNK